MRIFILIPIGFSVLVAFSMPSSLAKPHEVSTSPVAQTTPIQAIQAPKVSEIQELATLGVAEPIVVPKTAVAHNDDYYLDWIAQHESSNNPYAINEIGACGLFQSLPCSKVLSKCGSLDNVACQQEWGLEYAISRYGSTEAAYNFWQANRWW